jgi:predicted nuclease of predicted toxin-antitoxin system
MRFLIDESVDFRLAGFLASRGHDVTTIIRDYRPGMPDREVLAVAIAEGRILVTNDRDFGELVFRRQLPHSGVILLRLSSTALHDAERRLARVIADHEPDLGEFLVVSDRGLRIRRQSRA